MRDKILEFVSRELVGPDPIKPHVQENGEEILLNEPPRLRYSAGVLFPSPDHNGVAVDYSNTNSTSLEEETIISLNNEDDVIGDLLSIEENKSSSNVGDDFEEEIGLANSFLPSAIGFSCFSEIPLSGFDVQIKAGIYEINDYTYKKEDGSDIHRKAYFRYSLDQSFTLQTNHIPLVSGTFKEFYLSGRDNKKTNLVLNIRNRTHGIGKGDGIHLLTFTLINRNIGTKENIRNEDCYFQVSFSVRAQIDCFFPYKTPSTKTDQDDERSNQLLYRNKRTFAVGHGCSPKWDGNSFQKLNAISTETIPRYEIRPILPNELTSVDLKMFEMSDLSESDIILPLTLLTTEYEKWISEQESIAKRDLEGEYLLTAERHIENCRDCLRRMRDGVNLLKEDSKVERAFRLMNRAMLLQQLHYGIDLRNWTLDNGVISGLDIAKIPDINDSSTWPRHTDGSLKVGSWRPFQIAFILINLHSMRDFNHKDRTMVDLIWFPTGGGKTEAYLGLSGFTIFLKRLNDNKDSGTTVLMRYTLRLLTAQQFQRAASLVCACEKIRKENPLELGIDRITIGLWVGELTPNRRSDAVLTLKKISQGREEDNPFVLLKCPWCGAQMGLVKGTRNDEVKGYKIRKVNNHETVVFKCDNERECDFSSEKFRLPLIVIDEDIYESPPTLLIGTVDKFAMLTWRPEARSIFGFTNGERKSPPELIIQDELHLISGPLGSMVGLYETMIEEFCTLNGVKPKIIASSATISRAKEQINSLYGRGISKVNIFPAQCLNAGDSFFAYEEKDQSKAAGRLYVGIFASALPSHATAQVRVLSAILQTVKSISVEDEKLRDPYWTILTYFNSIRELGHAATLIRADITEYLNSIYIRKKITGTERRFVNVDRELTSRINSSQITDILEELQKEYPKEKYPIDVCLATNMVSVGVDISRLGLMAVIGQPKTTSEYIQATSRVGRSKKGPGIVFTIYNCSKPRDRSHFEHFQEYHSKIYSKVEPTSVTPFSPPARERALHAIIVGLIRFYSQENRDRPIPYPTQEVIRTIKEIIFKRVSDIDIDEVQKTMEMFDTKLEQWKHNLPIEYSSFVPSGNLPLMYSAGTNPSEQIKLRAWSTPTSMRNVDATCDAVLINEYINIDNL